MFKILRLLLCNAGLCTLITAILDATGATDHSLLSLSLSLWDNNLHFIYNTQVNKGFGLIECHADSHRCYSPKWHKVPQAYMTHNSPDAAMLQGPE